MPKPATFDRDGFFFLRIMGLGCVANFGPGLTSIEISTLGIRALFSNRFQHDFLERLPFSQGCGFARRLLLLAVHGFLSRFGKDHG
ncbi:hypothetical protein [Ruegeria profundi]|uniref:hypothetical protein n=1 Tax=Ruegeria profundi TaxID=1685378 RepID=UPI001969FA1B|nr:hypothetical protein [Ruegeria profundi]